MSAQTMSAPQPSKQLIPCLLEVLEDRIAPAAVISVGAPLNSEGVPSGDLSSYNYKYAPAGEENPFKLLGSFADAPVYGVDLANTKTSDVVRQLKLFNVGEGFQSWITINSGAAQAFFRDANRNDVVEANELTGFSFTDKLNLTVDGSVFGDIVGTGASANAVDLFVGKTSITALKVSGSVLGSVVAAGNISNVEIAGTVERISTASRGDISFNLGLGEQTLKAYAPAFGVAGGSLNNLKIGDARIVDIGGGILPGIIEAGDGGSGAAGGSVAKVTVVDDPDGLGIFGGTGGSGSRGGAGGSISQVLLYGAGEVPVGQTPGFVRLEAGDGGSGSTGLGGVGGGISGISIGYSVIGGKVLPSPEPSGTPVVVGAGDGGIGTTGGAGGAVKDLKILVNTPDREAIDEISISAGTGGVGTSTDGAGGAVTSVTAENVHFNIADPSADRDSIVVRSGTAGEGSGQGAKGGAVSKLSLLADRVEVLAGAGSDGAARGGTGGGLSGIELMFRESEQVRMLNLRAGDGGDAGASGRAGAGGAVAGITANYVDLLNDVKFTNPSVVAGGNGGSGIGVGAAALIGGAGGSLSNVRIFEPTQTQDSARLHFLGGDGGLGSRTGGVGGGMTGLTFIGFATTPSAQAGQGGNASAGSGGAGGSLRNLVLRSDWVLGQGAAVPQVGVAAGAGGSGLGPSGAGGVGGSATNVTVRVTGPIDSETQSKNYLNTSPEAPVVLVWNQFDQVAEKASLVDIALRVTGSVQGSFVAQNTSPLPGSEIVVNGATSGLAVSFSGAPQAPAGVAVLPSQLSLGAEFLPTTTPPEFLSPPVSLESSQQAQFTVGSFVDGRFSPRLQSLTPLQTDLLSSAANNEPFFSGTGQINTSIGQDFVLDYVTFGGAKRSDLAIDTTGLLASGKAELTYRFMNWVDVDVAAGVGGSGVRSVGAGGALSKVIAITSAGDASLAAGDAGSPLGGASRGAAGGPVNSSYLAAGNNVSVLAGDGQAGGKGGSITGVGWQKNTLDAKGNLDGVTAPLGNVILQAGHGSALGSASGAGGSVTNSSGFSSSSESGTLKIFAGDGSGAGGGSAPRGTAGGAITNVNIFGGAAAPEFVAGQAGKATAGSGGAGGSISSVSVAPGLDILQLAAGNGGDGTSRGGAGGSVGKINAFGDIGERSGKNFGFDTIAVDGAGGIFAGAGGSGPTKGKAGNVTDVTAAAISSIVAGRPTAADAQSVQLVSLADRIYLRGLNPPTVETSPAGSFSQITAPAELPSVANPFGQPATTAFVQANMVGAIAGDPFAAGANVFKLATGPVAGEVSVWALGTMAPRDGLIAAITLGQNKNFRPEALLTVTDSRNPVNFVLFDYRNNFNDNN